MDLVLEQHPELKSLFDYLIELSVSSLHVVSIYVFGDIVLNDFSKMYSDINLLIVLDKTLWGEDYDNVNAIMGKVRTRFPFFSDSLDVAFIPEQMIENPRIAFQDIEGIRIIGKDEMLITKYPYSHFETFLLVHKSHKLYGKDISFPLPAIDAFWQQFMEDIPKIEEATAFFPFQNIPSINEKREINWILYFSRMLYALSNNDVIGRLKSAYWFLNEFDGAIGDFVVEVAMAWKKGQSLEYSIDVTKKCQELLLFSIRKALELRKIRIGNLEALLRFSEDKYDYKRVFMEVRNAIGL